MAGDFRKINSMIWSDSSWRALPPLEQWLYFALLTNSKTSYVGVLDWRPRKLAGLADGVSGADLEELAQELQRKRFILIDEEREECLVRSFIKHDGVLKNQNLGKSIGRDFAATYSEPIRQVIVHEVQKLVDSAEDDLKAVTNKYSRPFILEILRNPSAPIEQFLDPQSSPTTPQLTPDQRPEGAPGQTPEGRPEPTPGVGGQPTGGHPPSPSPSPPSKEGGLGEGLTEASSAEIALIEPETVGPTVEDFFNQFWEHWPKKMKKPDALKAFKRAVKEKRATPERIVQAAEIYSRSRLPEKRFIPHPATWLNNDQWNDLEAQPVTAAGVGQPTVENPGAFTNWSLDDYRPWASRPHVVEAQERVDDARSRGEEPTDDDLRTIAGPDGG